MRVPGFGYLGRDLLLAAATGGVQDPAVSAYVDSVVEFVGNEEERLIELSRHRRSSSVSSVYTTTEARMLEEYSPDGRRLSEREGLRLALQACDELEDQASVLPNPEGEPTDALYGSPKVYSAGMRKDRTSSSMDFSIRVAAVVPRDGALLLVRHQKPDRDPYWVLPGGRLEPGEKIPECAEREILEETGLSARFSGVLYVSEFLREGRHTVDISVRMVPEGDEEAMLGSDPEVAPGAEPTLRELRWVEADDLQSIELLPPWIKARLIEDAADGWPAGRTYLGGSGD